MIYFSILAIVIMLSGLDMRLYGNLQSRSVNAVGLIIALFFAVIVGLRWDVGVDYMPYYNFATGDYTYDYQIGRLEPVPRFLALLTSTTSVPFYVWFMVMGFIQIFYVQRALKSVYYPILCWGTFFFIAIFLHEQLNIVRQGAAVCIVLFSYQYVLKKDFKRYLLMVLLACMFHKSAVVALPIYLLRQIDFRLSLFWQAVVVVCCSVLSSVAITKIFSLFTNLAVMMGYGNAMELLLDDGMNSEKGSGLGILFNYLRYAILIFYYPKLRKEYSSHGFNFFYLLSFIYLCIYPAAFYSIYIARMFMYFRYADVITYAFLMHYLTNKSETYLPFCIMLVLTLVQIFLYVSSGAPWTFIWESPVINKFI